MEAPKPEQSVSVLRMIGGVTLGLLAMLNLFVGFNILKGRNVIFQKPVTVLLSSEEETEQQREIVEQSKIIKRK